MANIKKEYIENIAEKVKKKRWNICVNEASVYREVLAILKEDSDKKYKVVPLDDKYVLIKEK